GEVRVLARAADVQLREDGRYTRRQRRRGDTAEDHRRGPGGALGHRPARDGLACRLGHGCSPQCEVPELNLPRTLTKTLLMNLGSWQYADGRIPGTGTQGSGGVEK